MKLNPVAQASAIALQPDMTDIERAAAEKMPIKDAMTQIARNLVGDLDAALQVAIERYLRAPITDPETLRGRLTNVTVPGIDGETWRMDGMPVLWAGPVAMVREGNMMHGERKLAQLLDEVAQ